MTVASDHLRIAIIPATWPADAADFTGTFHRDQAMALRAAGHQVIVLALRTVPWRNWLRHGIDCRLRASREDGLDVLRLALPELPLGSHRWRRRLWQWGGAYLLRVAAARYGMPDVLHAHCIFNAGIAAIGLRRKFGVPCVLTEHNSLHLSGNYPAHMRGWAQQVVASVDARLCVSPVLAGALRTLSEGADWQYVPNVLGVRFLDLPPVPPRTGFRFVSLASMHAHKNQALLLEAFALAFPDAGADIALVIGGDGPLRDALARRAQELGVTGRVSFPGYIPPYDVPSFMQAGDCFLLASNYETFGVVLIEALACGLPLIATRCGGPEVIVDGSNGQLVPVGDAQAMAVAMRQAYARRATVDREALARQAVATYGPSAIAGRLATIYRRVLAARAPS